MFNNREPKEKAMTNPVCCLQVNSGRWCQESYETASYHAGIRANNLRKAGYQVSVSPMGLQLTRVGLIKLTLVDIRPGSNPDTCELPAVEIVRL
jgi:hypothetical protein